MNIPLQDIPSPNASTMVLIVDDDAFSHTLISTMLKKLGVTNIHTALNGQAGLSTLEVLPCAPDIIICDVFMPEMDGIEFMAEMTKRNYKGGIILLSGQDVTMMDIAQQVAVADGLKMLGAYTKPVPLDNLADALARNSMHLA